jgi:hypothetical protein
VKINRQHYWPTKDERTCSESHIVCCNKFDFVLDTIYTNPFNTSHFGWIDAFLGTPDGKALRICQNYAPNTVPRILHQLVESGTTKFHIQQLNVNDKRFLEPEHKKEYYSQYRWVVCGGFFVTAPQIGIQILSRLKEIFVQTTEPTKTTESKTSESKTSESKTTEYGFGHGEEMYYLEILNEYQNDLALSYGDYGQILDNFILPCANIEYVYYTIVQGLKKHGHHEEYKKACKALLQSANNYWIQLEPHIYHELVVAAALIH